MFRASIATGQGHVPFLSVRESCSWGSIKLFIRDSVIVGKLTFLCISISTCWMKTKKSEEV